MHCVVVVNTLGAWTLVLTTCGLELQAISNSDNKHCSLHLTAAYSLLQFLLWSSFSIFLGFFLLAAALTCLFLLIFTDLYILLLGWQRGIVISGVRRMNKLLRRARLGGWPSFCGYTISVCNSQLDQLSLASLRGRLIEYQLQLGMVEMSPLPGGR